ncbi:MAG: hypothetical protein WC654_04095 [Patescibacteria group bacterium]
MLRFLIITLSLIGCSGPMALSDTEIDEICSKVNDENWHSPAWNRSSQEECRLSRMNIADEQIPCTFGGLAGWCRIQPDGSVRGFHRGISTNWMDISIEEIERVAPHLVILK